MHFLAIWYDAKRACFNDAVSLGDDDDNDDKNVGLQNAPMILQIQCIVSSQICFGIQLILSSKDDLGT